VATKASEPTREGRGAVASADAGSSRFGLATATALVVGTIIGVGIFNLPTSLAAYGPISLVSLALTTVGALALALLFASLSRRLPANWGPYVYARAAFGNRYGFANAWSYWITAWSGNAAIAVGFIATVGLFYIDGANYTPFNISGQGALTAIGGGMAIALFSDVGVECVSVAAGKVATPTVTFREQLSTAPCGSGGANAFTTLVLMAGITAATPYGFSALERPRPGAALSQPL
jgi:amino acid transporter